MIVFSRAFSLFVLLALCLSLSGCELVEGVFKLGMWTAAVLIGVLALAAFAAVTLFRRAQRSIRS